MTEYIGTSRIAVDTVSRRKWPAGAIITLPETAPMSVEEAELFMLEFIDAIILAREIDGDPLPPAGTV